MQPNRLTFSTPTATLRRRHVIFGLAGGIVGLAVSGAALLEKSRFRPRILVLGVGGEGNRRVAGMASRGMEGVNFAGIHTSREGYDGRQIPLGLLIDSNRSANRSFKARRLAERDAEGIKRLIEGVDVLGIVSAMADGDGPGIAPVVGRIASQAGAYAIGAVALPEPWQTDQHFRLADFHLQALSSQVNELVAIDQAQLLEEDCFEDQTMEQFFAHGNSLLTDALLSALWAAASASRPHPLTPTPFTTKIEDLEAAGDFERRYWDVVRIRPQWPSAAAVKV